jgi:hypothetical protein
LAVKSDSSTPPVVCMSNGIFVALLGSHDFCKFLSLKATQESNVSRYPILMVLYGSYLKMKWTVLFDTPLIFSILQSLSFLLLA